VRVIGIEEFGGPEKLRAFEVPDSQAGAGEVRIRVRAATVNPSDTLLCSGAFGPWYAESHRPPYVPGMEAAGEVDQLGVGVADATGLALGDRVTAIVLPRAIHGGAYAEHVVVPPASVVRLPAGASEAEAATLPMNGITARLALDLLGLAPGQTVAVTGAAGAVGGYVIQLAKHDGLRVIADAGTRDEDLVRSLGADVVVARGADIGQNVRDVLPHGADGLVDAALQGVTGLRAVRDGGTLVAARPWEGGTERGITIRVASVSVYAYEHAKLDRLRELVEEGALTLRVARTLPATEAAEAHRQLAAGGTRGRLVLDL
jgi:NADPH:quinone reductase-like Zn-dependent oxidoreductase